MDRRHFLQMAGALSAAGPSVLAADKTGFTLNYMLASSMYGQLPLAEVLPQVAKTGTKILDVWPKKHGSQREQIDELAEILEQGIKATADDLVREGLWKG